MKKTKRKNGQKGITLIALIITIIVLIILAGISIAMISGQNGILNKTAEASVQADIAETKEKIKLELMGKYDNNGKYSDTDVINAVLKVTGNQVQVGDATVLSKKGNSVKIADLWQNQVTKELTITCEEEETESRAIVLKVKVAGMMSSGMMSYEEYARDYIKDVQDGPDLIKILVDGVNYVTNSNRTWEEIAGDNYSTVAEFYNSLPSEVTEGTSDYKDFMVKEKVIDPKGYEEKYAPTVICNGQTEKITSEYAEFGISVNGEYDVSATTPDGGRGTTKATITKCKIETFSNICDTNTEITSDGYTVTVPAGFAYGTSDNVKSVNGGLVITDSVDSNGNSTGNEYVWIPVDKTKLTVGNTDKKMAKISSGSDYEGVLYNFSGTSSTEMTDYGLGTTNEREPDIVSNYDGKSNDPVGIKKENLQKEYNDMIASIKKYGGFYVARYEAGIENGKVTSKIGITPTSADNDQSKTWYGLYSLAKTYTNNKNSVTSQMIWGSQYDAMLNFALTGNDKSKVKSTEYGNDSRTILRSGLTRTSDKINNIYDLGGNLEEWTSEASYTDVRAYRGGLYNDASSPANRSSNDPTVSYSIDSLRSSLYVK